VDNFHTEVMALKWQHSSRMQTVPQLITEEDTHFSIQVAIAELAISSPAVVKTIKSTHCTYPQRDDQAEWSR